MPPFDLGKFLTALFTAGLALATGYILNEMKYRREHKKEIVDLKESDRVQGLLDKLSLMRPEGVALRNDGKRLSSPDQLPGWQEKVEKWTKEAVDLAFQITTRDGGRIKTLNRVSQDIWGPNLGRIHIRDVQNLNERLSRIETLLDKYDFTPK